jgi:hypothetical protein
MKVQSSASDFFLAAITPDLPLCKERMVYACSFDQEFLNDIYTIDLPLQPVLGKSASGAQYNTSGGE